MPATKLTMERQHFDDLRAIIYERSGIRLADSKRHVLESRLSRRLEELGLDGFGQYVRFLSIGPYQMDEFQEMLNRITVNETSFFRNEPQLDVFESVALSDLLEARRDTKRLRIWSAACSTGEEPYTIAMQLHRVLGVRLADWHIEILGTDISERALDRAQKGVFPAFSFRSVNPLVIKRYFTEEDGAYRLDPSIMQMVSFELHNLKDRLAPRRRGLWDVVFCRNVLMHFDDAMKSQVAEMFHDQLEDDGYLFIGHSESLQNLGVPFTPVEDAQAFAYRKSMREA